MIHVSHISFIISSNTYNTITKLVFLPANTTSRFQPMDVGIIASFKAHYRKLMIQHQIDCLMADKEFVVDVYQVIVMVQRAWTIGVIAPIIQNCWKHTYILSNLIERETEEARHGNEVDELAILFHQLTLLSSNIVVSDVIDAHEFINYELEFDLNNPYQPTDEDFLDMLPSEH